METNKLLIGTSGYDYPEWRGGFYPEKTTRAQFLEFYATQFNSLELNGTYYRMPTASQMQNMINRTNGKVQFSVKAFNGLTHSTDKSRYQFFMDEFKKALEPLHTNNVLLCALFQFPEDFLYSKEHRLYLDALLKETDNIPIVVEMRNAQWQHDQVYNALRQRKIGWCISDNPKLKNLPKLDFTYTSDIAYLRFHGRNVKMWYKGDNTTRYDYHYSDAELQSMVDPIRCLLAHATIVQIFFNNHAKSQAAINAKKLEMLLTVREIDPAMPSTPTAYCYDSS
jgi:uncharacterized protein YecE (DUF72 family)